MAIKIARNCLDQLLLGYRHHVDELKQGALRHVGHVGRRLFAVKDWDAKIRARPDLMKEIIEAIAK
jgi:hypothetical protein